MKDLRSVAFLTLMFFLFVWGLSMAINDYRFPTSRPSSQPTTRTQW